MTTTRIERWLHRKLSLIAASALVRPENDYFWAHTIGGDYLLRVKFPRVRRLLHFRPMLHHFGRSDHDREHHNHPFNWSISLILVGGYTEERVDSKGGITTKRFRPGMVNIIRRNDFHRIELTNQELGCWTFFIAGKRVGEWGFRDNVTGFFIPWTRWTYWRSLPESEKDRYRSRGFLSEQYGLGHLA